MTNDDITINDLEPVFIVDGEEDPDNPLIVKVEIAEVINVPKGMTDEALKSYLGNLLADACCDFNMAFTKTKEAADEVVRQWEAVNR
jgi:hypothetical protein